MEVLPMDTVRGRDTWHTLFRLSGGIPFYHVNDRYEAWADTRTLTSLRFFQDIDEGNYEPKRHYEIFPDRKEYIENDKAAGRKASSIRVDEGFLMYFLRTVPLARRARHVAQQLLQGRSQSCPHSRAPPREGHACPAGEFNAIVIQPIIKSKGCSARAATRRSGYPTTTTASCCR